MTDDVTPAEHDNLPSKLSRISATPEPWQVPAATGLAGEFCASLRTVQHDANSCRFGGIHLNPLNFYQYHT